MRAGMINSDDDDIAWIRIMLQQSNGTIQCKDSKYKEGVMMRDWIGSFWDVHRQDFNNNDRSGHLDILPTKLKRKECWGKSDICFYVTLLTSPRTTTALNMRCSWMNMMKRRISTDYIFRQFSTQELCMATEGEEASQVGVGRIERVWAEDKEVAVRPAAAQTHR